MTNEEINLAVAAIAGWTNIELWNPSLATKTYIGTNALHPELGKFIPKYTESLDAIVKVFQDIGITFTLVHDAEDKSYFAVSVLISGGYCDTPALALCKLLLAINPAPIAR